VRFKWVAVFIEETSLEATDAILNQKAGQKPSRQTIMVRFIIASTTISP
jgi:hypothetical protein